MSTYGGDAISWRSKLHDCTLSTIEAEYIATSEATKEAVKNQDRFCAAEEMIWNVRVCMCVRERERVETQGVDTENTQGKVY